MKKWTLLLALAFAAVPGFAQQTDRDPKQVPPMYTSIEEAIRAAQRSHYSKYFVREVKPSVFEEAYRLHGHLLAGNSTVKTTAKAAPTGAYPNFSQLRRDAQQFEKDLQQQAQINLLTGQNAHSYVVNLPALKDVRIELSASGREGLNKLLALYQANVSLTTDQTGALYVLATTKDETPLGLKLVFETVRHNQRIWVRVSVERASPNGEIPMGTVKYGSFEIGYVRGTSSATR